MAELNELEIKRRLSIFMDYVNGQINLSLPMKMAMQQFLPKVPEFLAYKDEQEKILKLVTLICWVIGYKSSFKKENMENGVPDKVSQPPEAGISGSLADYQPE